MSGEHVLSNYGLFKRNWPIVSAAGWPHAVSLICGVLCGRNATAIAIATAGHLSSGVDTMPVTVLMPINNAEVRR